MSYTSPQKESLQIFGNNLSGCQNSHDCKSYPSISSAPFNGQIVARRIYPNPNLTFWQHEPTTTALQHQLNVSAPTQSLPAAYIGLQTCFDTYPAQSENDMTFYSSTMESHSFSMSYQPQNAWSQQRNTICWQDSVQGIENINISPDEMLNYMNDSRPYLSYETSDGSLQNSVSATSPQSGNDLRVPTSYITSIVNGVNGSPMQSAINSSNGASASFPITTSSPETRGILDQTHIELVTGLTRRLISANGADMPPCRLVNDPQVVHQKTADICETGRKSHPKLAPKSQPRPSSSLSPCVQMTSDTSPDVAEANSLKRKRRKYSENDKKNANDTRLITACIRCRGQRIKCQIDRDNPEGPCLTCQKANPKFSRLPCCRYKISEHSQMLLFRTGLGPFPFYQKHPLHGQSYGDFYLNKERQWICPTDRSLQVKQDVGGSLNLRVRKFIPPNDPTAVDLKNRPMYCLAWSIFDPDCATDRVEKFLEQNMLAYLNPVLNDPEDLVRLVFHAAAQRIPECKVSGSALLVYQTVRLWVASRFLEGKWRCCGMDNLGAERSKNPFRGPEWVSPPAYVDYQLASIIVSRILTPLRNSILTKLGQMVESNSYQNWFTIFIVMFILLHNYELTVSFQRQFWEKRGSEFLYGDMELIGGIHATAKALLAHFHFVCKGNIPFSPDFDWEKSNQRRMAHLERTQVQTMSQIRDAVQHQIEHMSHIGKTDDYDAKFWFTGQLFENEWKPKNTYETSPLAPKHYLDIKVF